MLFFDGMDEALVMLEGGHVDPDEDDDGGECECGAEDEDEDGESDEY